MKTIVFDFGGVLFRTSATEMYRERFAATGRTPAEADSFLSNVFTKMARSAANRGTMQAVTTELARQHPVWAEDILAFNADRDFIRNVRGPVPGMHELLQEARQAGITLYGLTNWAADTFNTLGSAYPDVISSFAHIVVSGRVGVKKPDRQIFELAQTAFNNPDPATTLYVDDKPANVQQAQAVLGWQGHVFRDAQQLRQLIF